MSTVLPGHSIPYAYTPAEVQAFVTQYGTDPVVGNYLTYKLPPYGVIFNQAYGQLLVWYDASDVLHVIDVTNLSIAQQVQLPDYQSLDSNVVDNITKSVQDFVQGLKSAGNVALAIGAAIVLWKVLK